MNSDPFRVFPIDHVELFVPKRRAKDAWYESALGLIPATETAQWAEDPEGSRMIALDQGKAILALFQGTPQCERSSAGFHRVAFRVDAKGFLAFLDRTKEMQLSPTRMRDHDQSISIYFDDPYGPPPEVTTYEPTGARPFLPCRE